MKINPADAAAGAIKYRMNCIACHGDNVISAGAAPDLRESEIALNFTNFSAVVHNGALLERGMPKFDQLSQMDLRQIHAFIRLKAREAIHSNGKQVRREAK
jgi:quinohemoprotein ethanol dehydrogenase